MPEPRLPPLPAGKLKIHAEHFRKVVRRIEAIKPLAGKNISIAQTEDGIEISADDQSGIPNNFTVINLVVCEDGFPATIQVLGLNPEADG